MSISILVLTYNEESNLRRCLQSVDWSDDIVVIDSGSTDNTIAIAQSMGARVLHRPFDNFASQRNFGIESGKLKYPWVLHLDADECVPAPLAVELQAIAQQNPRLAYGVAMRIYFQGSWIKRSSMYPCYQVRFGRTDHLRFEMSGHGQREKVPADEVATLRNDMDHHSFSKGMADWFEKHNRYSTDEARQALRDSHQKPNWKKIFFSDRTSRRRELKHIASWLPCKPFLRFLYIYVLRMGFLDGRAGWDYAHLIAIYQRMISLKLTEAKIESLSPKGSDPLEIGGEGQTPLGIGPKQLDE